MLRRIVLADDDPNDVELTLEALGEHRLVNEIIVVRDGTEVLDYLHRRGKFAEEPPGDPILLLLDLKMPKLNGVDVLRQIKSSPELKSLPVVILTSSRQTQDLKTCYELGANAYVVKPVNFGEFVEAVRQVGTFWTNVNEPPPTQFWKHIPEATADNS